jgi:hypothetical protein
VLLASYLRLEGARVGGGGFELLFTNVSDNLIVVDEVKLYAILPRPIEVRRFLGLGTRRVDRLLVGSKPASRVFEVKPGETRVVYVEVPGGRDVGEVFDMLRSRYGWEGLLALLVRGEAIVGYAVTLTDSRAKVYKRFQVEYELRVGASGVEEFRERRFELIF